MLLSICIPTYNRVSDLKACLHSVCAAVDLLDEDCEVLVSDNASPDETASWLSRYKPHNPKTKVRYWTNKENIGAVRNIHLLARKATGQFIFYLTDDDLVLPAAFSAIRAAIKSHEPDFIKTAVTTYLQKSKACWYYGHNEDLTTFRSPENFLIVAQYSHVLSGCVIRNSPSLGAILDAKTNAYPSIRMCALHARRSMFLADPVIFHTWENPIFWEKDVDLSSDATRKRHTDRDCQLAFLDTPKDFLPPAVIQQLYQRWMETEAMERIEPEVLEHFGVNKFDIAPSHVNDEPATRPKGRLLNWLKAPRSR